MLIAAVFTAILVILFVGLIVAWIASKRFRNYLADVKEGDIYPVRTQKEVFEDFLHEMNEIWVGRIDDLFSRQKTKPLGWFHGLSILIWMLVITLIILHYLVHLPNYGQYLLAIFVFTLIFACVRTGFIGPRYPSI